LAIFIVGFQTDFFYNVLDNIRLILMIIDIFNVFKGRIRHL